MLSILLSPYYTNSDVAPDNSPSWVALFLGGIGVILLICLITGIGVAINNSRHKNVEGEDDNTQPTKAKSHGFLKFILALVIIVAVILGGIKIVDCTTNKTNNDGATKLLSRTARTSDIRVSEKDISFSPLGVTYSVIPTSDIDGLEIKVKVYNSSKSISADKTVYLGTVQKSVEQTFVYSLSDLNITISTLASWLTNDFYWSYDVTGGTVSYFA
ncbi:MAG: hypothetical protein HDQ88_04230 [Clostridia bacterium]|nr:hypothetical protein [Clostridia bacterium]